ncbi:hypothetical protein RJ639_044217 [Escallonia herrerae]|uniref:Uncharacterized protein n=1 Tax=Escallonia herrerae TaxID=1293975 RepID=A0AA88WFN2_9ASTE|nr:hypothetical protein RJ639_044217 [Escallonia herrerae]
MEGGTSERAPHAPDLVEQFWRRVVVGHKERAPLPAGHADFGAEEIGVAHGAAQGLGLLKSSYSQFTVLFYIALILVTAGKSGHEQSLYGFTPNQENTRQKDQNEETTKVEEQKTAEEDEKEAEIHHLQNETTRPEGTECWKIITFRKVTTFFSVAKKKTKKNQALVIWWSISVIGSVIGSFALPYLTREMKWSKQLEFTAILMGTSLIPALLVTLFYTPVKARGSPLSHVPRVLLSALLRMNRASKDDDSLACNCKTNGIGHHPRRLLMKGIEKGDPDHPDPIRLTSDLRYANTLSLWCESLVPIISAVKIINEDSHPIKMRYLHEAAAVEPPIDLSAQGWRLCTVQQVQETKLVLRMVPLTMTLFMYGIVKAVGNTYFIEQGSNMDPTLGTIDKLPIQVFVLMSSATSKVVSKVYDITLGKRIQAANKRVPDAIKIGFGMAVSIFCCLIAAFVETKRLAAIKNNEHMTVFWLTPQFLLLGAMDGLARDGIEGFFSHQGPPWLKTYAVAFAEFVKGFGTMLSVAFLLLAKKVSKSKGYEEWFQDSIDTGGLNYFYEALAVLAAINFGFYVFIAWRYSYKATKLDESKLEEEENPGKKPGSDEHMEIVFEAIQAVQEA